jgi:proline iminopeptidase
MRHLFRISVVSLFVLGLSSVAWGQDGSARAEFDCLKLANSSSIARPGMPSEFLSYHHVWTPGLEYGEFESNGVKFLYETQGEGPETVIVLHGGAGLPHEYFHPMLTNLSRYARVVYFDRRADMMSEKSHAMASLDELADDVDALRVALGLDRVTLLGHSFGGAIALNYALRHPDNTKRLILVSASAAVENPAEAEKRLVKTLSPAELAAYSGEGGTGGARPCERVRRRYGVLYPHYFAKPVPYEFDRGVYTVYFDSLVKRIALADDSKAVDVRARLSEIKAPVLVISGRHDLVTLPEQSFTLAQGLPTSRYVILEHSGHFPFFEENYMFTQWVRTFIEGTSNQRDDRHTSAPVTSAIRAAN